MEASRSQRSRSQRSVFDRQTRQAIYERAGYRCERCRSSRGPFHIHHRRPRMMGGSSDPALGSAENGALLCVVCHRQVESDRSAARQGKWLVEKVAEVGEVPVGVVDDVAGAESDVSDEASEDGSASSGGGGLLNGASLLLGEHVDGGFLNLSEVPETLDRIVDAVEVGGDGLDY